MNKMNRMPEWKFTERTHSLGAPVAQPSPAAGASTVPVRVPFHPLAARRRPNPQARTPALRENYQTKPCVQHPDGEGKRQDEQDEQDGGTQMYQTKPSRANGIVEGRD